MKKTFALVLSVTLTIAGVAAPAEFTGISAAQKKPKLSSDKGSILTGESEKITIKNVKKKKIKKLTVSSSNKRVAGVKKSGKNAFAIKTKKAGKATVSATLVLKNDRKYKLKYKATVADTLDRKVTVVYSRGDCYKLPLRFFADTPHIPYVRATTYYSEITRNKKLKVKKTADGKYLLTVPTGETATVDTDTDTLTTDRFLKFVKVITPDEGETSNNASYGGAPFLQPLDDAELQSGRSVTLKFSEYGLDLLGDKDDIWLPLETAANLFLDDYGATMFYTGNRVYHFANEYDINENTQVAYMNDFVSQYPNGVRPTDTAEYTYWELAFLIDTQWGNPGRCYFSDAIREIGFDRALSETDDATRSLQRLLKSTDMKEYLIGRNILQDMLYDGGHTTFNYFTFYCYSLLTGEKDYSEFWKSVTEEAEKNGYSLQNTPDRYFEEVNKITENRGWEDNSYHEQGDTAVFSLNTFNVDIEAWENYYKNGGEVPDDTYGSFIKYLDRAEKSGEIKNFVLDVTANTGGDDNALAAMFGIMRDEPNLYFKNTKSGQIIRNSFKVDKNLDGRFDEKDDEVKYPFRFAILTSELSFSCGNLLSCFGKTDGIMVIGERSRGGECTVVGTTLGDGMYCRISSTKACVTKNYDGVEGGAEPDKVLEHKKNEDGTVDYSAFYDIPSLSRYINSFYG